MADARERRARAVTAAGPWPPRRPPAHAQPRPRLESLLDDALAHPLTSVVAPTGTGKTVLAASWARRRPRTRWLAAADHGSLGPALLAAAGPDGTPDPSGAAGTAATPAGGGADAGEVVELLAGRGDHDPDPVVVDDAHLLPAPQLGLLDRVLRECPAAVRLVLLGRHEPALPLVRLDLDGTLTRVGPAELRFTREEARRLLAAQAAPVAEPDLDLLLRWTDGWAAPLVVGGRARARRAADAPLLGRDASPGHPASSPAPSQTVAAAVTTALTGEELLEHLFGEELAALDRSAYRVVLACALEQVLEPTTAAVLSGVPEAGRHLAALAADGLLLPADPEASAARPAAWRWHPMLGELLQRRAGPGSTERRAVVDAQVRAATTLARRGDGAGALRHARRSGDLRTLLAVLEEHGTVLVATGEGEQVSDALAALPAAARSTRPHLLALDALLHRSAGRLEAALRLAHEACDAGAAGRAEPGLDDDPGAPGERPGADALARVHLWRSLLGWEAPDPAILAARRLLRCALDERGGHLHPRPRLLLPRSAWLMVELAAVETWRGDLASAAAHLRGAEQAAGVLGHAELRAAAMAHRSVLELAGGSYRSAADTAADALAAGGGARLPGDVLARAHLVRGWSAVYALDLGAAEAALREVARLGPLVDPLVGVLLQLVRCRVLNQRGHQERALRLLTVSDPVAGSPDFLVRLAGVVQAETAARCAALPAVRDAAATLRARGFAAEAALFESVSLPPEPPDDVLAAEQAVARLDEVLRADDLHPATGAAAAAIRMGLLVLSGRLERARALVPDLLSRVQPQRLLLFLDVVTGIAPAFPALVAEEAAADAPHPWAGQALALLEERDRPPVVGGAPRGAPPTAAGPEPAITGELTTAPATVHLTPRQADVLEQLALGASYRDIADALVVSEATVKSHLLAVYRKLGVTRRSDALRRAREEGLV